MTSLSGYFQEEGEMKKNCYANNIPIGYYGCNRISMTFV